MIYSHIYIICDDPSCRERLDSPLVCGVGSESYVSAVQALRGMALKRGWTCLMGSNYLPARDLCPAHHPTVRKICRDCGMSYEVPRVVTEEQARQVKAALDGIKGEN